eukprot:Partr_v1_DN28535_c0_g1_i2_m73176 putative FYVE, RhoGEF and PH domain containing
MLAILFDQLVFALKSLALVALLVGIPWILRLLISAYSAMDFPVEVDVKDEADISAKVTPQRSLLINTATSSSGGNRKRLDSIPSIRISPVETYSISYLSPSPSPSTPPPQPISVGNDDDSILLLTPASSPTSIAKTPPRRCPPTPPLTPPKRRHSRAEARQHEFHEISANFSGVGLKSIPVAITLNTCLVSLDLSNNQLSSLSECIGALRNLRRLNISRNKLRDLPACFSQLNLLVLVAHGNPWDLTISEFFNPRHRKVGRLVAGVSARRHSHSPGQSVHAKLELRPSSSIEIFDNSSAISDEVVEMISDSTSINSDISGGTQGPWAAAISRYSLANLMSCLRDLHELDPGRPKHRSSMYVPTKVLDSAPSKSSSQPILGEDCEKYQKRRQLIMSEIVSSELSYVTFLSTINSLYIQPLKSILSKEDHRKLFSNLESLYLMHADTLLPSLESAVSTSQSLADQANPEAFARVFTRQAAYLRLYTDYINNFDASILLLDVLKKQRKFTTYCNRIRKDPRHSLPTLQFYLIMPIQRLPRYTLLLNDLLHNTPAEMCLSNENSGADGDPSTPRQALECAYAGMSALTTEMNERKRMQEMHEEMVCLQSRIKGQFTTPLVQPHRKMKKKGWLRVDRYEKRTYREIGKPYLKEVVVERDYFFVVFNDIMVQCSVVSPNGKHEDATTSNANASIASIEGVMNIQRIVKLENQQASLVHCPWITNDLGEEMTFLRIFCNDAILYARGEQLALWMDAINSNTGR